jgi:hypothetical protein
MSINNTLNETVRIAKQHGASQIALCVDNPAMINQSFDLPVLCCDENISANNFDALIIIDKENFPTIMRKLDAWSQKDFLVLPADPSWVVTNELKNMNAMQTAWQTTADTNYIARSGLRGHYVEFGTYWGRSFFPAYFRYRDWLQGDFFAFDSFRGLSKPSAKESEYTGGDFQAASYCCNQRSFEALAALVNMPASKLKVIPGFYADTLGKKAAKKYGLTPESISVCVIDCDLKEPTEQVLAFVTPLLEPGALIYFDDWRLCRASPKVGERAAAINWLKKNKNFELVEFHRDSWQHQWFIFHK